MICRGPIFTLKFFLSVPGYKAHVGPIAFPGSIRHFYIDSNLTWVGTAFSSKDPDTILEWTVDYDKSCQDIVDLGGL